MLYSRVSHFCEEREEKKKKTTENSRWRQKSQVMKSFHLWLIEEQLKEIWLFEPSLPHWRESVVRA